MASGGASVESAGSAGSAAAAAAPSSAGNANGTGTNGTGGGGAANDGGNAALATMLRDCAYHIERDQFHPVLYEAMAKLHAYTGDHASVAPSPAPPAGYHGSGGSRSSSNGVSGSRQQQQQQQQHRRGGSRSAADGVAADYDIPASQAPSFESSGSATGTATGRSKEEEDYLKDIKKEFKAIGKQFKKFGVGLSGVTGAAAGTTTSASAPTSTGDDALDSLRDAARKTHDNNSEWCEVHFVMGCGCKNKDARQAATAGPRRRANVDPAGPGAGAGTGAGEAAATAAASGGAAAAAAAASASASHESTNAAEAPSGPPAKPCFHRPNNPNSNLIANGWIEQQRRSKMRIVWKDILASLVEGRRPGEETTLWIQRQITNAASGRAELEALHQIPMKWLEDVNYLDFYGDHRFSLKIYNVADEFQFRTADEVSAKNWVATLVRARDASLGSKSSSTSSSRKATSGGPTANQVKGMNHPLDDWGNEGSQQQQQAKAEAAPTDAATAEGPVGMATSAESSSAGSAGGGGAGAGGATSRMSVKELRSIAHGAGINTYGMERADLERIAARLGHGGQTSPAPGQQQQHAAAPTSGSSQGDADAIARAAAMKQQEAARAAAVEKSRQEAVAARSAAAAERQRHEQQARAAAEMKRRQEEEEALRIRQQEWARQQREAHARSQAEAKRKQDEAAAAARAAEQQRQWQQQQWQQQQWQKQQQQQQQQAQQQAWQQQQQQAPPPPPPPGAPPPQYQQHQHNGPPPGPQSPVNAKYAKMTEEQSEEAEQASITRIKREILINWALVPPQFQMLRPIHQLIVSIHTSFPPAYGVTAHDYFGKWKPITPDSISLGSAMGGAPDEEKLKKAVRKIRFFLHPDKLPRDLNSEQSFMCRMLWDVTSDSWEEHCKQKEELDWIR